ncbi:MAG: ABC transporter substrate-binding protein [bacterium]|nr:ABC transporter substrate-binding protein [bacterium]MCP4966442.1 ABC transporter substrate-binding protein [bacterium]
MRKVTKLLMLLVVFALLAAACGDSESDETTAAPGDTTAAAAETTAAPTETSATPDTLPEVDGVSCDEPITVGVITDLTGALAIYGAHVNRGVPIGFAYATGGEVQTGLEQTYMVDDCEINVVFKDDQTNAELSATAARELIEVNGADIIIGSVSSGVTATLQGIARENDVILIAAPAAATDITGKDFDPNTFRASRSNYQDAMALCDQFVNGNGYTTFVQIAPDYSFGYGGAAGYKDACTFYGGEFIEEDVFAPADTTDFTSYMTPLADTDAEALLVTWAGGGFVPLLQSAIDLGVIDDDTVLGSPFVDNIVMPAFFSNAIGTTSVILYHYTAASNPVNDYLIEQVAANFETVPDLFDADGMNAAIMVVEALKATAGASDADSLRAALEGISFEGPKGLIEVRPEDHVALQDMYVVTLLNIDDPAFMYYENVATVRPEPPCLLEGDFASRCGSLPAGSLGG